MSRKQKVAFLPGDDEKFAEAQKLIKDCRENKRKKLDFSLLSIKTLPAEIGELDTLEELIICNNTIEIIPATVGKLGNLKKLHIYSDKITALPKEIGKLVSLNVLDLLCPQLLSLPDSFSNLKAMQDFRFKYCNLPSIPAFICGWTKLKSLVIEMSNTFQGPYTEMKIIPKNIGNLKSLKHLSLNGTSIIKIPESIGNCPLEHLELAGVYKTIPEDFGKLIKLETLKLFSEMPITLPDSFGNLSSLKKLETHSPVLNIPDSISTLASLEELSILTENIVLPKNLNAFSSLKELHINAGMLQDIPKSIGECKNLKKVFITSDMLSTLPETFCELKNLEELHLDTFSLKELPGNFGSLASLNYIDIFSGVLIDLPESMSRLKKINKIYLDAHNLKKLPDWLTKLSYAKRIFVKTAKEELTLPPLKNQKAKEGFPSFDEFTRMSNSYRWKMLDAYTVKDLESILCSAPIYIFSSEDEKHVFKDIMLKRSIKLNKKYKWTLENKKRIAKVSEEFLKAWESGFAKAKTMMEALYKSDLKNGKDTFEKAGYFIEITLHPEIITNKKNWHIYDIITSYLNSEIELRMQVDYDPVTKDEQDFRENIYVSRELSWNIEGFGDIELDDYYICYALHVLYSHNEWANEDIEKINNIYAKVKISFDNEKF